MNPGERGRPGGAACSAHQQICERLRLDRNDIYCLDGRFDSRCVQGVSSRPLVEAGAKGGSKDADCDIVYVARACIGMVDPQTEAVAESRCMEGPGGEG
jgi:hypothetical protein